MAYWPSILSKYKSLTDSRSALKPGMVPRVAIDDADKVNGVNIEGSASSNIVCPNVSNVNFDLSAAFRSVFIAWKIEISLLIVNIA